MRAIKEARKFIESNAAKADAVTLSRLVLALESEIEFPITDIYLLDYDNFKLALEILQEWRLDRHFAGKTRLYDASLLLAGVTPAKTASSAKTATGKTQASTSKSASKKPSAKKAVATKKPVAVTAKAAASSKGNAKAAKTGASAAKAAPKKKTPAAGMKAAATATPNKGPDADSSKP